LPTVWAYPSIHQNLSIQLPVLEVADLSIYLSIYLSIDLSIYLAIAVSCRAPLPPPSVGGS
jgi:hypothetical protein